MKSDMSTLRWSVPLAFAFTCGPLLAAETPDFQRDVLPIFQKHCVACHSADEAENDFALENYDQLVAGGKSVSRMTAGHRPAVDYVDDVRQIAAQDAARGLLDRQRQRIGTGSALDRSRRTGPVNTATAMTKSLRCRRLQRVVMRPDQ